VGLYLHVPYKPATYTTNLTPSGIECALPRSTLNLSLSLSQAPAFRDVLHTNILHASLFLQFKIYVLFAFIHKKEHQESCKGTGRRK
jgi:hypothetical protein